MKRVIHLLAIATVIGGLAMLTGCDKETWSRKGSAKEVKFGATAHSSAVTRTEYMDYNGTDANQKIKWLSSDKIRIYSPNAARRVAVEAGPESTENPYYYWADYQIIPDGTDPTKGTLKNLSNDGTTIGYDQEEVGDLYDAGNGLVWLDGEQAIFYGAYPQSAVAGANDSERTGSTASGVDGQYTFTMPFSQSYSQKGDMSLAFMTAKSSANQGENITLNFYPDFTAFEISIKCAEAGDNVKLNSFTISAPSSANVNNLAGQFIVNLSGSTKTYSYINNAIARKEITVNMGTGGVTVPGGASASPLVFTVFALPNQLDQLTVQFNTTSNGTSRVSKLDLKKNNSFISFAGGQKHRIYGLVLPSSEILLSVGTAPWLAGGESTYTTIENVTTRFISYQRYVDSSDNWFVAIAPGRSTEQVNTGTEEAPNMVPSNRPLYSPGLTLETVSVGVSLQLRSSNPKIGFVQGDANGVFPTTPSTTLDIPASTSLTDVITTTYFVVPFDDCPEGAETDIMLIRLDNGAPIAYTHDKLPGSHDHTKVPFKVMSVSAYSNNTTTVLPD